MSIGDPSFPDALSDDQVRIWINSCNHEPARQALRQLLAYRNRGIAAPLRAAPAVPDWVADMLKRRTEVEGVLRRAAAGKRDLPTAEECRALANKLSVPSEFGAEAEGGQGRPAGA